MSKEKLTIVAPNGMKKKDGVIVNPHNQPATPEEIGKLIKGSI